MALSIKEKYDLIYAHEEQLAYRLGKEVINKPEVSVWMILIPILFLHHMYKINQYKAGVSSFAKGMLDPRKKALDMAYQDASQGRLSHREVLDYFPELDAGVEQQMKLAQKQVKMIQVLQQHYFSLLRESGQSYEDIIKKAYPSSGDYRRYMNSLEQAEKELYTYLNRKIHTNEESRKIIKNMEKCSQRIREDELRYFF
ncbi:MAG: NF038143 family protein [Desulfonatronovibrio sp.]